MSSWWVAVVCLPITDSVLEYTFIRVAIIGIPNTDLVVRISYLQLLVQFTFIWVAIVGIPIPDSAARIFIQLRLSITDSEVRIFYL